jgi:hypothetical protein
MKRTLASARLQNRLLPFCFSFISLTALAAVDEIPPLRPPRGELHPSFWELHGWVVLLAAFAVLGALAFLIQWLQRPKLVVATSPEAVARQALSALHDRPEDAVLVAEVTRILRRYIYSAFSLPPDELTTTEFYQALQAHPQVGTDLATAVGDFLRQADERKFAAVTPSIPSKPAVAGATELLEKLERHRQQVLRPAQPQPGAATVPRPAA